MVVDSRPVAVTKLYYTIFPLLTKSNHLGNFFKKYFNICLSSLYLAEWSDKLVNKYMLKVSNGNNREKAVK